MSNNIAPQDEDALRYSDQFFIVFDQSLTIFYLSPNSNKFINTMSNKLIGQPLNKIILPEDLVELSQIIQSLRDQPSQPKQSFVCHSRFKASANKTKKYFNSIPGYKLYKVTGTVDTRDGGLIHALCKPIFVDELMDRPMEDHIFITLLSVDTLSILHQDQRAQKYINLGLDEVKGQSAMSYIHSSFVDSFSPLCALLFKKGESMTDAYLSKSRDGWIWLRSRMAFYYTTEKSKKEGDRKVMIVISQVLNGSKHISDSDSHNIRMTAASKPVKRTPQIDTVPRISQEPESTRGYPDVQYGHGLSMATQSDLPMPGISNPQYFPDSSTFSPFAIPPQHSIYDLEQQPLSDTIEWDPSFSQCLFSDQDMGLGFNPVENSSLPQFLPSYSQDYPPFESMQQASNAMIDENYPSSDGASSDMFSFDQSDQ